MRKNIYAEKLNLFKSAEIPETVLLIADSPHLTKIVVAWINTPVQRAKKLSRLDGGSENDIWSWLWRNTRFSREDLLSRIPSCDASTDKKIDALIANRVLYPDGTVNSFVEKFLRERVLKHFIRNTKKRP